MPNESNFLDYLNKNVPPGFIPVVKELRAIIEEEGITDLPQLKEATARLKDTRSMTMNAQSLLTTISRGRFDHLLSPPQSSPQPLQPYQSPASQQTIPQSSPQSQSPTLEDKVLPSSPPIPAVSSSQSNLPYSSPTQPTSPTPSVTPQPSDVSLPKPSLPTPATSPSPPLEKETPQPLANVLVVNGRDSSRIPAVSIVLRIPDKDYRREIYSFVVRNGIQTAKDLDAIPQGRIVSFRLDGKRKVSGAAYYAMRRAIHNPARMQVRDEEVLEVGETKLSVPRVTEVIRNYEIKRNGDYLIVNGVSIHLKSTKLGKKEAKAGKLERLFYLHSKGGKSPKEIALDTQVDMSPPCIIKYLRLARVIPDAISYHSNVRDSSSSQLRRLATQIVPAAAPRDILQSPPSIDYLLE